MESIIYTKTDEAPLLATHSLLPIIQRFCASSGVHFELKDISLAGRILATFPEYLRPEQRVEDALALLGDLTKEPTCQYHQAPQHQCLCTPAQGCHSRTTRTGICPARLP